MRRPLKPFVTEYKGSRRGVPALSDQPSFESERQPSRLAELKPKGETDSEDSYEAAMRAADALFAARPSTSASSGETQRDPAVSPSAAAVPERGGRILRVVDEAPPPEYAEREAQLAPKRRGRKPGSKNKPKTGTAAIVADALPSAAALDHHDVMPLVHHDVTPLAAVPAQRMVAALPSSAPSPRGEKRSGWARGKLKPGEDWKRRRLPRVCW